MQLSNPLTIHWGLVKIRRPPSLNLTPQTLLCLIMQMPQACMEELVCPMRSHSSSQPRIGPRPGHTFPQPMRGDTHCGQSPRQHKGTCMCNVVHFSLTLEAGAYIA